MPGKNNESHESPERSKELEQHHSDAADQLRLACSLFVVGANAHALADSLGKLAQDIKDPISKKAEDFFQLKQSKHLSRVDHFDKDAFNKFLKKLPEPEHKVGAYIQRVSEPRLQHNRKFADLADNIGQHYANNAGMVASEKKEIGKRFSEFSKERAGMPYSQSELVRDFIPLEKTRYQFDHDKNMVNISKKADQKERDDGNTNERKLEVRNGRKAQNEYISIRKLALAQFVTEKLPGKDLRADSEAHKEFLSLFEKDN